MSKETKIKDAEETESLITAVFLCRYCQGEAVLRGVTWENKRAVITTACSKCSKVSRFEVKK